MKKVKDFDTLREYDSYAVKKWKHKNKAKPKKKHKKVVKKVDKRRKVYNDYLKSAEWATIKIEMRAYHNNACEVCGSSNGLEVHHKTYKNFMNEEPKDLMLVCKSCHKDIHSC